MSGKPWLWLAGCLGACRALAADPDSGADQWLDGQGAYPPGIPPGLVDSNRFSKLHAEALAGRFKVVCPGVPAGATLTIYASADPPGHWPARDWRPYVAERRGDLADATVPVEDLNVPIAYFAVIEAPPAGGAGQAATNSIIAAVSPLRLVTPRAAGLAEPSSFFWPFLDGFEEGIANWRLLAPETGSVPLRAGEPARTGRAALVAAVPAGKRSVTLATTCVRGRQIVQHKATGLRLWVRTREGQAQARFTLEANAFAKNQVLAAWPREVTVSNEWQKVDLFFAELPQAPLAAVDLFAMELIAPGLTEFYIDNLQLIGPWRVETD